MRNSHLPPSAASQIWTIKDGSAWSACRGHPDSQRLKAANQTRRVDEPDTVSIVRPDTQLPWHLEEKAFWCGRQNGSVFVFPSLCCCRSVRSCLSLSDSHCTSVLVSVSFIIFYTVFFFLSCSWLSLSFTFLMFSVCSKTASVCVLLLHPCGYISVLHCRLWSNSQTPSPHCQGVIAVKPDVSPTEPGAADLPSSGFHLCLNGVKAHTHTHRNARITFICHAFPTISHSIHSPTCNNTFSRPFDA